VTDAGGDARDAGEASVDAPYDDPTTNVTGVLYGMDPPAFQMNEASVQYAWVDNAVVDLWASGRKWTSDYAESTGFKLAGVPAGEVLFLIRNGEGVGDGMLPTALWLDTSQEKASWNLPVVTRPSFVVIYGSVQPQRYVDSNRAQWLLSFGACKRGSGRKAGVLVVAPTDSQGVVYDEPSGWKLDAQGGTGANGIGIVVNVPAEPVPGRMVRVKYRIDGKEYESDPFPSVRGYVTRFHVKPPC